MNLRQADVQLRHYAATLATLRNARKAIEAGPSAGVDGLDIAIAAHEKGARAFVEELAATRWWNGGDIPALAALIPLATALVGANDSVAKLAVSIGRLCQPRSPVHEAA